VLNGKRAIASNQQKVDVWGNFYERYKEIRDYHKRHNPQQVTPLTVATLREQVFLPPYREPVFSGEEALGKQVDMNALYHEYKNLRQIREVHNVPDYLYYLQHFDDFHTIPYAAKDKDYKPYKRYLENLVNYLKEFFVRV
jgi:splicing factor 3A subunit 3